MDTDKNKAKFDEEVEALWAEGTSSQRANQYLAAVAKAGESKAGVHLRAKILDATDAVSYTWRIFRLAPVLVPALILLWIGVAPEKQVVTPVKQVAIVEDEYLEIAALMDDFMGDDIVDDELAASYWIFFSVN